MTTAARTKRVAILQSNYIPWKGYFDLVRRVDEFILFDTVQYTRRDWRNRNLIKVPHGVAWLTIPVQVKGRYLQSIQEIETSDPHWKETHWKTLQHNYSRAPHFAEYRDRIAELYLDCQESRLSRINHRFLVALCEILGIRHNFKWASDFAEVDGKTERLVAWCKQTGATEYWSGPAARDYIDEKLFAQAGIRLCWMDYSGYPEYRQLYPPFEHKVSVLDLLFNEGPDALRYMKSPE